MGSMIRKKTVSIPKRHRKMIEREMTKLLIEQDYELASLHMALKTDDENEINKSKTRLKEIHSEMKKN